MPWKECHVMDERVRFISRLLAGEQMARLCAEFGISRKTGYKIYRRYKGCGVEGLTDRSRRPQRHANQLPEPIEKLIVRLKREYPTWGAPKIRERLRRRYTPTQCPAISTVHRGRDPDRGHGQPARVQPGTRTPRRKRRRTRSTGNCTARHLPARGFGQRDRLEAAIRQEVEKMTPENGPPAPGRFGQPGRDDGAPRPPADTTAERLGVRSRRRVSSAGSRREGGSSSTSPRRSGPG